MGLDRVYEVSASTLPEQADRKRARSYLIPSPPSGAERESRLPFAAGRFQSADGFAPVGPAIATGLDYKDLMIETRLNGTVQQSESSKFLIHNVDEIVEITIQGADTLRNKVVAD